MAVELIPGTALPYHVGPGGEQHEGRGQVHITPDRAPRSLFERLADRDDISPAELAVLDAAVRHYDDRPKDLKTFYGRTAKVTDATTGNLVVPLFLVPAGTEAKVTQVTVDTPQSTTINPSAPFANASSWAFIAVANSTTGQGNASADSLRAGLVTFAPSSAAGPILPGQWTFNDTSAPIAHGGDQIFYVIHGGSIAGVLSTTVQVTYRINLMSTGRI